MQAVALTQAETDEIHGALLRMGLAKPGQLPLLTPLAGGVSSLIVKAELGDRAVCVKRALPKLKVASDWSAPVERSDAEAAWIRTAAGIVPDAVPQLLGQDSVTRSFAMSYLEPADFPVWKSQLLEGVARPATATAVASNLVAIHNATANRRELAETFANHDSFMALRLDPYFVATARRHPDCEAVLWDIVRRTAATQLVLIHGDVSPKNILIGAKAPILLDAECATYGDPAFDISFCLNHLLLKSVWRPSAKADLLACFEAFTRSYLGAMRWEPVAQLEQRACRLLPAMLLARIDGKSPVEYLSAEPDRERVRRFAKRQLGQPGASLLSLADAWNHFFS